MAKTSPLPPELLDAQGRDLYEAINHENPLPCVLISASYIEQCLATLVHGFLIKSSISDGLFDHKGGLLTEVFSRAKMAYCLGLVDKSTFQNVNKIGEIRNAFAHSHLTIDFDDPKITLLCSELQLPKILAYTKVDGTTGATIETDDFWAPYNPRGRFQMLAALTTSRLIASAKAVRKRDPNSLTGFRDNAE